MELKPKKGINTDAHRIRQRWENDSPSRHACRNSSSHLENHKFESTTTEMSGFRFTQQQEKELNQEKQTNVFVAKTTNRLPRRTLSVCHKTSSALTAQRLSLLPTHPQGPQTLFPPTVVCIQDGGSPLRLIFCRLTKNQWRQNTKKKTFQISIVE